MSKLKNAVVLTPWATLALRVAIGCGFIVHGWAKFMRGPSLGFAKLLHHLGVPAPGTVAWLVTLVEILGGLLVLAGAFVTIVGVPLIVVMLVAMFSIHVKYGFSAINTIGLTTDGPQFGPRGYEVNLLYITGLLVLMLSRASALSIDRWLERARVERT